MKKPKSTLTPRDKYLRKKYGRTEEEVNAALAKQDFVCKACGRPPSAHSLHLDHDHAVEKWRIVSKKVSDGKWAAWPEGRPDGVLDFIREGRTKPEARAKVKEHLKRLSTRGMLCYHCNSGLQKFQDDPVRMHKAANYLNEYYDYLNGKLPSRNGFE